MTSTTSKVTFGKSIGFRKELNRRVNAYFEAENISPRDNPAMYLKTAIILAWVVSAWTFVVFGPDVLWMKLLGCIVLGFGVSAVGFNISHDGNHGGYSKYQWVNYLSGLTHDAIGVSSYLWKFRHNVLHHTYTNILGHDVEIHGDELVRMSPSMEYRWYHRYQHLFIWFVYPFIPYYWSIADVQTMLFKRQYHDHKIPTPTWVDIATLLAFKAFGVAVFLIIPIAVGYSPLEAVIGASIVYMTHGMVACVVFMLAHVIEPAEFLDPDNLHIDDEWAIAQVKTTVDFAPKNPIINWYVGGLNYQAVHHLFPHICHIHYPKIAPILAEVCEEFGVNYAVHQTFFGALGANYSWLKKMSINPETKAIEQLTV
ncbi:fatty acid desaturase family protein [Limnospira platensis CENA597]|uniref:fatty acid desaturase family protein n=1 Tax=Limnospira platensis TaxID=118562 RepID=UPI003D6EF28A